MKMMIEKSIDKFFKDFDNEKKKVKDLEEKLKLFEGKLNIKDDTIKYLKECLDTQYDLRWGLKLKIEELEKAGNKSWE